MTEHVADRRLMRLLAAILTALWAAVAVAVAATYGPGGPIDVVVALACFVPVLIADAGVVWPALGLSRRDRGILVWVWIAAVIFVLPILYGIASSLVGAGPQSLVPSFEEGYAAALALVTMAFFSTVGIVHRRRGVVPLEGRASAVTVLVAVLLTAVVGAAFVFVAVINDQALRRDEPTSSRFGPTDPDIQPPFCDEPVALGDDARISIEARSGVDTEDYGAATLEGQRGGRGEAWGGDWSTPVSDGRLAYVRVGPLAWLTDQSDDPGARGTLWSEVPPDPFELMGERQLTMDGPPHAVADAPRGAIVAEDLGLEIIDGARARHCRTFIDGPTALDTFLPLRWLLYDSWERRPDAIGRWRGELDWWVFADGELGLATVEVSGSRAETDWDATGVRAILQARLTAIDRDRQVDVSAPGAADIAGGASLEPSGAALQSESP